ncbi:MAG: acyltransferase [Acidimicrobiia bacterium]|nr:acyltransferase [Acidimicrobiia bacterium]
MAATGLDRSPSIAGPRFAGFDGLRALAALAVLLTHVADTGGANGPNILGIFFARMDGGVAIFFVISGVLLYRPFVVAHLLDRPSPRLVPYFWRRALRIYPAYWLAMTVVVYVLGVTEIPSFRNFLLDYSLLHIYSPHQPDVFAPLVQSWTLATEVAFYLFLPVWAAVVLRIGRRWRGSRVTLELIGVGVLIAVSTGWKAFVLGGGFSDARIGQLKLWLPWWLDLFALGMGLAVLSVAVTSLGRTIPARLDRRAAPMLCWLGALGTFWWVAAGAGLGHTSDAGARSIAHHLLWGQHYLYGATAFLLVVPTIFRSPAADASRIHRFLQARVMVFLGTISYGIYLWHEAWIDRYLVWTKLPFTGVYTSDTPFQWHTNAYFSAPWLIFVAAVLGLTVASATASWYGFERPIMKFKRLFR